MTLEDHAGDVLRKARIMSGVDLDAAAKAARLDAGQYAEFEDTGRCAGRPDLAAAATLVGLNGARLEKIAAGWLPAPVDWTQWRELRQITTDDDGMKVHCYLVWDEASRDAALFDTGMDARPVQELIAANDLILRHIFITHAHSDHVAALADLRQLHPRAILHMNAKNAPPQHRNRPNDCVSVGSLRVTHRETPGHAEDGVTYLVGNWPEDAPYVALVGDAIFAGSMGRAADGALAKAKVREQILSLPPETLICPGHGTATTVAEEKANNPFFG